jgi:hypothetical protein
MMENHHLEKIRTQQQNKALHLWCQQVADTLNEGGISYKMLLDGLEIDQTMETIKSLFRLIAGAKFGVKSTSELTTKQLMDTFEEFNKHLATKGVYVAWPSIEPQYSDNY